MANTSEMVDFATNLGPDFVVLFLKKEMREQLREVNLITMSDSQKII
ncbi:MAG: hypothetical protein CM15mP63_0310 [Gammaproteobacteria bacterium]|nr:MAG: hypothetical protein CM15mP63_0310 [Gammaproteobacteria bacterium]